MYTNSFGVIEVASARTTHAPGWAYVPDTGVNPTVAALQPSNRKRARNHGGALSGADLSARQEAKVRKELETLDRDTNRDIPVPATSGGVRASKSTPGVRKILQSQKTFSNHLDDYSALLAQAENSPAPHPNQHTPKPPHPNQHTKRPPQPNQHTKRPPQPNQYTKRNVAAESSATGPRKKAETSSRSRSRRSLKAETEPESEAQTVGDSEDVDMIEASPAEEASISPILTPYSKSPPPAHPGDSDPLLISVIPDLPSNEEVRKLLAHSPLTYAQARANYNLGDKKYPVRKFCDVCGYWGRVKCIKCGTRVCALDCLDVHHEGCLQRYGL